MNRTLSLALLVVAFVSSGCSMRKPGFPRQSLDPAKQIAVLEEQFPLPTLIKEYYEGEPGWDETTRRAKRNQIISGRQVLIDLNYNDFIAQFSFNKEAIDTAGDWAQVGLDLASTAVPAASTKTVLSGIATGLAGWKLSIDKTFFYEKTVPVLITSMNAARKAALVPIVRGVGEPTLDYPLARALSDLDAYYFAGTFVGALQAIQADAGAKEEKALAEIREAEFGADDASEALQTFWMPGQPTDTTIDPKNQERIQAWMNENNLSGVPIQFFMSVDIFAEARKKAVQDLGLGS